MTRLRWASTPVAAVVYLLSTPASAWDASYSAFGTLGYARSDRPYTYQRFVDDRGTFKRDSVLGLQIDARLENQFSATVQAKIAPATASDSRYEGTISWAFLAYRPTNEWLFRVGKQRIPIYLYSETYDVGATYDFARLPTEMYSIVSSNDFTGVSLSKTWSTQSGDIALDAYWGRSANDFRFWLRDSIPGVQSAGASFVRLNLRGGGLVLTYRHKDQTVRIGLARAVVRRRDGIPFPSTFPFVQIAPGVGYYQVDPSLPGPGVPTMSSVTNTTITLGVELALPADFRIVSEFARSLVPGSDLSPQGNRGYVSLLRRFDKWTPYVTYAFLRSAPHPLDLHRRVNGNSVPAFVPGAAGINAAQRAGADQIIAFDQHSWAVGTSFSLSAKSKLKAEYLKTRVGEVSHLVDAPPRSDIRDRSINVLSVSYSFVF